MKFKDKFDVRTWDDLRTASDLNARRRLPRTKQRFPFKLQRGDQSKGFKKEDIDDSVDANDIIHVKLDENLNYIRITKAKYAARILRQIQETVDELPVSDAVSGSIFSQLSASAAVAINGFPDPIIIFAEDTPFTGSYNIKVSGSNNFAYSGIAGSNGFLDRIINNDSPTATGATWSFANSGSSGPNTSIRTDMHGPTGNEFHQNEYTSSYIIRTFASGSASGSYIGQATDATVSASRIDSGKFYNYKFHTPSASNTGSVENTSTAGYYRTVLKANVFGDGNETLFTASFNDPTNAMFAADREILTFPYDTVVASGGFWHSADFVTLVGSRGASETRYRPIRRVTLYWASGSGGLDGARGLSGSITPNQLIPDTDSISGIESGSHIFLDSTLTQPASGGYYTTEPLLYAGQTLSAGGGYTDPNDLIKGGFAVSGTIHVAGNGMRGLTTLGEDYFETPFVNAHELTSSILVAATTWNGISFSNHGVGGSYETGEINPGDYDDSND